MSSIKTSVNNDCATLYVQGSFAFQLQAEFRGAYEKIPQNVKLVQVDLYDADYMDSSGLGMLLVMKKYLDQKKVGFEIVRSRGQTYDLLSMTHFNQYFRINGEPLQEKHIKALG